MKFLELKELDFGSIEPLLFDDVFINRLKKLDKICHHFHLSLQSGCNDTLKRMNRRYTIEQFEHIVQNLRKVYDDVMLTTDIIVGFPGETEEEFSNTYEFLKRIKFYKMHIFKYSIREGTKAALMKNQVLDVDKEKRSKKLIQLSEDNQIFYNKKYIGKNVDVLIEEKENEWYKGHTDNYLLVKTKSENDIINNIISAKVEKVENEELIANCVTKM